MTYIKWRRRLGK